MATDGTQVDTYIDDLLAENHIRYGGTSTTLIYLAEVSTTRDASLVLDACPAGLGRRHRPAAGYLDLDGAGGAVLDVPMLSGPDLESGPAPYSCTTGTSALRDATGTVVETADQPGFERTWNKPAPGTYQLTVEARRAAPWSDLATRQHVVWDLKVGDSGKITLPAVRYRTALDADNRAHAGTSQAITLVPDGLETSTSGTPQLWASYDDGATWKPIAVQMSSGQWTASVPNPASGHVSLRTRIPGLVDQTVIDAYGIG